VLTFHCRRCGVLNLDPETVMAKFLLGPCLEVVEPGAPPDVPPPPAVPYVGLVDPITVEPGGKVRCELLPANPGDATPVRVHAVYVSPPAAVPPKEARTPEWFLTPAETPDVIKLAASTGVADSNALAIDVAGVAPGAWFVQTVLEYTE